MYRVGHFTGVPDWLVKMGCYKPMKVYSSVELEWMRGLGVHFTIVEGAWGSRFDFEFPQEFIDKKYYAKWVGQTHQLILDNTFFIKKTDLEFIENWATQCKCVFFNFDDDVRITYQKDNALAPRESYMCIHHSVPENQSLRAVG